MRLFLQILLGAWVISSLVLLLIFTLTPYAVLAHGWQLPNHAVPQFVRLPLPPAASYSLLRRLLAGATALGAIALVVVSLSVATCQHAIRPLLRRAGRRFTRLLWWYPAAFPRAAAVLLLLAVLAWRAAYLQQVPIDVNGAGAFPSLDEIASYDYFARPGPAVAASYYQLPNNHVAHNVLAAALVQLLPAPPATTSALAIRLPAILFGLLGLLVSFGLLRRYAGLLTAVFGTGGFYLLPLAVSYAVMGRGYALALACAVAGTWAALRIMHPAGGAGRALAWAGFVLASVAGLYAVPSHLYTVLAQGAVLLIYLAQPGKERGSQWRYLAVALGLGVALTLLLYAPVFVLSGWRALLDNIYVQPRPAVWFWSALGPALRTTAAELFGQGGLSSGLYVLLVLLFPLLWRRHRPGIAAPARWLGWLAYAQAVAPIPLMVVQRQLAPARTLLPAVFFTLVAALLLLRLLWPWLRRHWAGGTGLTRWLRPRAYGWQLAAGVSLLLVLSGYRFGRGRAILAGKAQEGMQVQEVYNWLKKDLLARDVLPAGAVVVSLRSVAVAWHHRALVTGQAPLPLLVAEYPEHLPPAPRYIVYYVIGHTDDTRPGSPWAAVTRGLVRRYHNATLSVYAVPAR